MDRRDFLKSIGLALGAAAAAPAIKAMAPIIEQAVLPGVGSPLILDNLGGYMVPAEFVEQLLAKRTLVGTHPVSQEVLAWRRYLRGTALTWEEAIHE